MPSSQTNFAWATLLDVDADSDGARGDAAGDEAGPGRNGRMGRVGPAHGRLTRALRTAIRDGRLSIGDAVPPSRALAEDLGCSRWVVTEAYGQLTAEGYLTARAGSATRVSWSPEVPAPARSLRPLPARTPTRYHLAPGLPDLREFPRRRWAEAIRAVAGSTVYYDLGIPDPDGHPALRRLLADYLRRSRGALVSPVEVTICAGIVDGLHRICRWLLARGITEVAVENPGWGRLRLAAENAGLRVRPVPVDEDGLRVADLANHGAVRAVIVGAAHQFPTGTVLAPHRRAALARWAGTVDGYVIEDDYDAEFRYDRRPGAVMQGMAPARVFLLGSVSKSLSPALGLGWLVAPAADVEGVRSANIVAPAPPVLDQLALALFIERGWYDAHLRAARRRLRARRDLLLSTLATALPQCPVTGSAAGLHVILHLPAGTATADLVARAAAAGLGLMSLDAYGFEPSPSPALVIGYGNIGEADIPSAVALLRAAIEQ